MTGRSWLAGWLSQVSAPAAPSLYRGSAHGGRTYARGAALSDIAAAFAAVLPPRPDALTLRPGVWNETAAAMREGRKRRRRRRMARKRRRGWA